MAKPGSRPPLHPGTHARLRHTPVFLLLGALAVGCGGGETTTTAFEDGDTPVLDASTTLRAMTVSFVLPERLQNLDTTLEAKVTVGGTQAEMLGAGGMFEADVMLPKDQQWQIYVGVRRVQDNLLLASAEATSWLGDDPISVVVPEQQFSYDFDLDDDGYTNIAELERGSVPNSPSLDYDADGVPDDIDQDDDNDGVNDAQDAFPFNGQEYADTDQDGLGNGIDPDDDGDGVSDELDAFPLDVAESKDSDGDGIGDNSDTDADGNGIDDTQEDSDGDGVPDQIDLFPNDRRESADADGDGIGDNADPDDNNNGVRDAREGSQIIVPYVDNPAIVIDGIRSTSRVNNRYFDEWGKAVDDDSYGWSLYLRNLNIDNTGRLSLDASYYNANFQMLHDGEYLYVLVRVGSEELEDWFNDSDFVWNDDSVDLYFDVGYERSAAFGDDDYQRLFRFRDTADDPIDDGYYSASGMVSSYATSYRHENAASSVYQHLYEIKVQLSSIGLSPGDTFGFDIAVNDDDDGGDRDTKLSWWAPSGVDEGWQRPSAFGKVKLQPAD